MITFNLQGNCNTDLKGSGLESCVAEYGDFIGFDLYTKNWNVDVATGDLFTPTTYKEAIQAKTLHPFNNIYDFDQPTPDNETSTSSTGKKRTIRAAKPEFNFIFANDGCFHEKLYDKRGDDRWDIALKFETGILYAKSSDGTQLRALNAGMFDVGTYKVQQGTDPAQGMAMVQLNNAVEWNKRKAFFTWEQLGFDMTEQNGVIDAVLSYDTTPVAGTQVDVKVVSACNESVALLGLDDPNEWNLGGTQASATTITGVVYNATKGAYELTLDVALVAADTVQPSLADVLGGFSVAEASGGELYQGTAPLATIS